MILKKYRLKDFLFQPDEGLDASGYQAPDTPTVVMAAVHMVPQLH